MATLKGDRIVIPASTSDPSGNSAGEFYFNNSTQTLKYNDGNGWKNVNVIIPGIDSVSGTVFNGAAGNITIGGTGFGSGSATATFIIGGSQYDVAVTPASSTSATIAVPSSVYNQSAGTSFSIKFANSDGGVSTAVSGGNIVGIPLGGTITTVGSYRVHTFTSSGTFTVQSGFSPNIDYIVVAGGAGGGYGNVNEGGGGGGAGGMITSTATLSAASFSVVIGAGGTKTTQSSNGNNGGNSSFNGVTALGGGGGGYCSASSGSSGGSGGGGSGCGNDKPGGAGTSGQGNAGGSGAWTGGGGYGSSGNGGGGGGKSSAGVYGELRTSGTRGGEGAGLTLNYVGSNVEYARGGLGGAGRSNYAPPDVSGGTGRGGIGGSNNLGGNGGSGVVVIRYLI
jgi:hypothetical protein